VQLRCSGLSPALFAASSVLTGLRPGRQLHRRPEPPGVSKNLHTRRLCPSSATDPIEAPPDGLAAAPSRVPFASLAPLPPPAHVVPPPAASLPSAGPPAAYPPQPNLSHHCSCCPRWHAHQWRRRRREVTTWQWTRPTPCAPSTAGHDQCIVALSLGIASQPDDYYTPCELNTSF
jgi:hypothetical protein